MIDISTTLTIHDPWYLGSLHIETRSITAQTSAQHKHWFTQSASCVLSGVAVPYQSPCREGKHALTYKLNIMYIH